VDRFWSLPRYPFISTAVQHAPEDGGVYALFELDEVVYVGRAAEGDGGLRAVLLMHLRNLAAGHPVTTYTWEISRAPESRERLLLEDFRRRHQRMPRWHPAA
jgi:hypothetical protein